jgi:hypothetical protein
MIPYAKSDHHVCMLFYFDMHFWAGAKKSFNKLLRPNNEAGYE